VASLPGRKPYGLEAAKIERVIAVKNRSHSPKTNDTKLQSFFQDQTGRSRQGAAYMKLVLFQKLELVLSLATLHFVGWVEPTPGFVGFRCTQPNLHFAGVIAKGETQQRPIKPFFQRLTVL
jgi:hypothetical protein